MSVLVLHLPPRPRLHPGRREVPPTEAQRSVAEVEFVLSHDGVTAADRGTAAPALLPQRDRGTTQVVAVLSEAALSWHRITLPKAPAGRLRSALVGMLEDELLDEPHALHLALQPDAVAGEPCWVAVTDRPWLADQLAALHEAGIEVDRIVPLAPPQDPGHAHLESQDESIDTYARTTVAGLSLSATWAHPDGVMQIPLAGEAAHQLLPKPLPQGTRLSATPTAAMEAERWFGERVPILATPDRWLAAARSDWNLRQFELAAPHRGSAAIRQAWQTFSSPAWRPVRWGLAALVSVQLVGLNALAWQQRRQLRDTRESMVQLLRTTHPQVRAVLDAPVQMLRETERLRAAAGQTGEGDLERLLQAAASAWPAGQPVQTLRFEPGKLTLGAPYLDPPTLDSLRTALAPAGWVVEGGDRSMTLRPAGAQGTPR